MSGGLLVKSVTDSAGASDQSEVAVGFDVVAVRG